MSPDKRSGLLGQKNAYVITHVRAYTRIACHTNKVYKPFFACWQIKLLLAGELDVTGSSFSLVSRLVRTKPYEGLQIKMEADLKVNTRTQTQTNTHTHTYSGKLYFSFIERNIVPSNKCPHFRL